MKHLYLFLFLIFLLPFFASAQSNYKPGYVVNLKGDTTKGFVDFKEWDKNPVKINFKANLQAPEVQKLSADDISAFAVNGLEYYEKYKVSVSMDQVDVEKLSTGVDTSSTAGNIFLRVLVKGKYVTLYDYKDDIKNRFFIKDNALTNPEELIYRTYLNPNEVTQIVTQPWYQNQLNILAIKYGQSTGKLTAAIEKTGYNGNDLTIIVNTINQSGMAVSHGNNARPVRFFAGAAIIGESLKYSGTEFLAWDPTSKMSFGPRFNIGVDAFLNPDVGRLILRVELSVTTIKLQTSSNVAPFASQSLNLLTSGITPQLTYNIYNTDAVKAYIGAGAAINWYVNSNNNYYYAENPYAAKELKKGYPNIASSGASFMSRAGVVLNKKYELFLIYALPTVVTDHYGSFAGSVYSTQLGINYLFGSK